MLSISFVSSAAGLWLHLMYVCAWPLCQSAVFFSREQLARWLWAPYSDGAGMDCFSRQSIRPPYPHCPPPCHVSPHLTMCSGPSTSPATHSFPPLQISSLSSPQGPDAKFLASVKLDCSLPEPGVGTSVQSEEAVLSESPGAASWSVELETELAEI
ncbi:hypothetical protein Nepgr_014758 [Nepenthes gracilis]|uniref:Uncharacterized protein n=1 Tax=Nepenthes gracilis TaxID=150966 RepID=A0AAD3SLV4_NEPGR|nr:hypothetical protein Nepgr_014758 [Nepenthes gracilis]